MEASKSTPGSERWPSAGSSEEEEPGEDWRGGGGALGWWGWSWASEDPESWKFYNPTMGSSIQLLLFCFEFFFFSLLTKVTYALS